MININQIKRSDQSIQSAKSHKKILDPYIVTKNSVEIWWNIVYFNVIDAVESNLIKILPNNGWWSAFQAMQFLWMTDKIPETFRPLIAVLEYHDIPRLELKESNVLIWGIKEVQKYASDNNIADIHQFLMELKQYIRHIINIYINKIDEFDMSNLDENDIYKLVEFIKWYDYLNYLLMSNDRIRDLDRKFYVLWSSKNIIDRYIWNTSSWCDWDSFSHIESDRFSENYYDRIDSDCRHAWIYCWSNNKISFFVQDDGWDFQYSDISASIKDMWYYIWDDFIVIGKDFVESYEVSAWYLINQLYLQFFTPIEESYWKSMDGNNEFLNQEHDCDFLKSMTMVFSQALMDYKEKWLLDVFDMLEWYWVLFKSVCESYLIKYKPQDPEVYKKNRKKLVDAIFGSSEWDIHIPDDLQKIWNQYVALNAIYQRIHLLSEKYSIDCIDHKSWLKNE